MQQSKVSLSKICNIITQDLERVENKLLKKTASAFEFVDSAIQYVIEGGGKRFRPMLLLLSAKACEDESGKQLLPIDIYDLAVVVELIHIASLVHDDVIDEADMRRGGKSLNAKWGNKVAVLVGDYLHARVFSILIAQNAGDTVMSIISNAAQAMCEGEVIHTYRKNDFDISQDDYLNIIRFKTGKLIIAACEIGARVMTDDPALIATCIDYGENLGIAFQIVDDVLDFVAEADISGKEPFNDLREGKLTFPLIYTRDHCTAREKEQLQQQFHSENHTPQNIRWISKLMSQYNAAQHCLGIAQQYADKAKAVLDIVRDSAAKQALLQLADYVVSRER